MRYSCDLFETKDCAERVGFLLEEYEEADLLEPETGSIRLDEFIDSYQWDDGFELPFYIMQHKNCELGTALKMFYCSEGLEFFEEDFYEYFDEKWIAFVEILYHKIENKEFKRGIVKFEIPFDAETRKERKDTLRIPEVFLTDIESA